MDSGSTEIVVDCGFFRIYSDGRVERFAGMETVPAGFDADTGVTSKDVVIDANTGVATRLYLPAIHTAPSPPQSDDNGSHHLFARVVAVSVGYRLAPEHPLPAAYEDSWAALNWAVSRADPWLSAHGDPGRVFVAGGSAGANIAHNMAIAAGASGLRAAEQEPPPRVEGVLLLHPSFAGEQRMEEEEDGFWQANKRRWGAIFPGARDGLDDPRINPMAAGAPSLAKLVGERLLVCTASEDPRAPRGRAYCEAARASGWRGKVEWFESQNEGHAFFVAGHGSPEAVALMDRVVAFIAGH
ncbi:2-hydroxyisoflavanone dehydratase-like isoform X2 [Miscanthus floridulus]|uniref:2-hydroxyisoflavanone dehydratase-like isoform X2 n=1 Tax=Miscanthus floridulus TaxID=154761 RepID=UPI003457636B